MGRNRKKRCLAFLMALTMMTGLFMGDAAGLLVKARGYAGIRSNRNYNIRDGLVCEGGGSSFYTGTICNDSWRR